LWRLAKRKAPACNFWCRWLNGCDTSSQYEKTQPTNNRTNRNMRTVGTKLIAVWGGCVTAIAIAASVTESWRTLNSETVTCKTEWLEEESGDMIGVGCTSDTLGKQCVKKRKKDGTPVYGTCQQSWPSYKDRSITCICEEQQQK